MLKRLWLTLIKIVSGISISGLILFGLPALITAISARSRLYSVDTVPPVRAAIVLGAGLNRDGTPTPILKDRVATAAALYFSGKVEKLLMSGDNRFIYYNEPGAMKEYAIELGVPEEAIVLDYAGRRTYDTCYRASAIFGLKEAIIVTQQFHLPRALYLCNHMGLKALGVPADRARYRQRSQVIWSLREIPATAVALMEVHITRPVPVLGQYEPIFADPAGRINEPNRPTDSPGTHIATRYKRRTDEPS